jgi:hypothetical protein
MATSPRRVTYETYGTKAKNTLFGAKNGLFGAKARSSEQKGGSFEPKTRSSERNALFGAKTRELYGALKQRAIIPLGIRWLTRLGDGTISLRDLSSLASSEVTILGNDRLNGYERAESVGAATALGTS